MSLDLSDFETEKGVFDFPFTGRLIVTKLPPGFYLFEVWGAQGGMYIDREHSKTYGYGGYSTGKLLVSEETTIFVYVGGAGANCSSCSSSIGGFNGGGSISNTYSGGGGGGTDIRVEVDDLYHRIIVAGGGGGVEFSKTGGYGGAGGGTNGQNGYQEAKPYQGGGGSQTSGGSHYGNGESSTFGTGGSSSQSASGGGGGGWYGGGSGGLDGNGGGGSGYVYNSTNAINYPGTKPSTKYYLIEGNTISGTSTFQSPSGSPETGHHGNGYARITKLIPYRTRYPIPIQSKQKQNTMKASFLLLSFLFEK